MREGMNPMGLRKRTTAMEFLKTVIIGYVAMVVNYLLVLCFLPVLLVCGLCWIAGGVSMIFLIPAALSCF